MEAVSVSTLESGSRFAESLYHASGRMILYRGLRLSPLLLASLKRALVEEVLVCDDYEAEELGSRLRRIETPLKDLRPGRPLDGALYDGEGELLLAAGQILLRHHIGLFEKKGLNVVFRLPEGPLEEIARVGEEMSGLITRALDGEPGGESLLEVSVPPHREPAEPDWKSPSPGTRPQGSAESILIDRMGMLTELHSLLLRAHRGGRPGESHLDTVKVMRIVDLLLDSLAADTPLSVAAAHMESDLQIEGAAGGGYLVDHSLNVAALAMAIAWKMGYGRGQLLEIGAAALLHDMGMLFIPAWVANRPERLQPEEIFEVHRHVKYGFQAVLGPWGLPTSVCVALHMYHERPDGSGYPDGRREDAIHDYARIVAVADVYDAVGHDRPYRPAVLPPEPAEQVARMAREGHLDMGATRSLLSVTSSRPPGLVVELSSGEIGRVVGSDGKEHRPLVTILRTAGGGAPHPTKLVALDESTDLRIVAALGPDKFPVEFGEGF